MHNSKIRKAHVRQLDQSDCGVACLLAALRYSGSFASLEHLRTLSGTTQQGTSLLGLREAALQLGFQAEGYKTDLANLITCQDLSILHTIKDGRLEHYLLCYGYDEAKQVFWISDPAENQAKTITPEALQALWQSGILLVLKPTDSLKTVQSIQRDKWHWVKHLIREDLNILGIALGIGVVVAALGLSTAIFSQKLMDQIVPSKDVTKLVTGAILLMVLLLLRSAFTYLRQYFLLQQGRGFNLRITHFFYSKLLHLPKSFFDQRKTGDLIARMNDTQRIQRSISKLASSVMIDVLMIVAISSTIFAYNWSIGLVALLWIPIFAYLVYRFHPHILGTQQQVMSRYAHNESNYVDTMQGIGPIKIQNRQSVFIDFTQAIYAQFQNAFFALGRLGIGFQAVADSIGNLLLVGVLAWSAYQVILGNMTMGIMIAILQLLSLLMNSVGQLAIANIELQEARVAFERMYEFTSIEAEYNPEVETAKKQLQQFEHLSIENLNFRYPGQRLLFSDVSLQLKRGEWISILGESGCGKSTLLQILQKFYTQESGQIWVNGQNLQDLSFENWRSKLGVVPQQIKLFNGTLLDNILMGAPLENPQHLQSFLEFYGFHTFFSKFPNGYATRLGEDGVNISGGQQQLVGLARALYQRPELLLLDEPTSALDRDTELFVLQLLDRLKAEMGILVLTHRLRTAKSADRIYIIEQGQIAQYGQHQDLLNSDNLYSRAWNDLVLA